MRSFLFWISILLEICFTLSDRINHLPLIKPGEYQRYQIRPYEQKLFQIQKSSLDKNTKYEVRISFLGNVTSLYFK